MAHGKAFALLFNITEQRENDQERTVAPFTHSLPNRQNYLGYTLSILSCYKAPMVSQNLSSFSSRVLTVLTFCSVLPSLGCTTTVSNLVENYLPINGEACDPFGGAPRESIEELLVEPAQPEGEPRQTGTFVLEDGGAALAARGWLTEMAKKTVDIQYFIFSSDNVGLIAADFLLRAAQRGVKVRIIVDDLLVDGDADFLTALDAHPNLTIKVYNPNINIGKSLPRRLYNVAKDFRGVNQRMHNKTFTVDGKAVITGGRNVADEYFDFNQDYNFRDRDVLLVGGTVEAVQASFEQYWKHPLTVPIKPVAKPKSDANVEAVWEGLHQYACVEENFWTSARQHIGMFPTIYRSWVQKEELQWISDVQFVSDPPGKNKEKGMWGGGKSTTTLINLVKSAKKSVVIQTPYLVTSELGQTLFAEAEKRGISVTILTNSLAATDNLMAFHGYTRNREDLLKSGVEIYEFRPDAAIRRSIMTSVLAEEVETFPVFGLHAKTLVVDDDLLVIATFNLDPRSANLNTECLAIIRSKKLAEGVLKRIAEELKPENSWHTTLESNPDSEAGWFKRFLLFWHGILPKSIL